MGIAEKGAPKRSATDDNNIRNKENGLNCIIYVL
ncbi:MAG: hypothetical protein JWM28_1601 [Chitinophagaceae bacterium]|nr:hypothetical protein [Chitinophagaceae bacterium]